MKIKQINWSHLIINLICLVSTFSILYWIFLYCSHGIDFTDEGFYLNWISNPFLYKASTTQFGYIYHPLFLLVEGNISKLRQFNFIITYILSFSLIYLLINKLIKIENMNKIVQLIICSGLALSSFTYLYIQTPSYNHLTFQALIVTSIGIVLIDKNNFNKNILGFVILGLGGWLVFMAKPSSAIGLGIIILIYLMLSKQFQLKFVLVAILTAIFLLIISALVIDGSIEAFFNRYILALEITKKLQSGHNLSSIFRIDNLILPDLVIISILLIFFTSILLIFCELKNYKFSNLILVAICLPIFFFIINLTLIEIDWNPNYGTYQSYKVFGIIFACIFISIVTIIKNKFKITDFCWDLSILFLLLPYIFALGSNNNYWGHSSIATFFWLLSGFVISFTLIIRLKINQSLIIFVIISQLITSLHIKERIEKPYRYNQSLRLDNIKITLNNKKNELVISNEFANYINDSRNVLSKSEFKRGDFIIDLSGQSPGLVYLLGAKSIGTPWNIGGYKGSLIKSKADFDLVNCVDIANSWVIYEKNGPISISTELLSELGAHFPDQYKLVGSWETAKGAGGYAKKRTQELYKPIDVENVIDLCNLIRMNG